VKNSFGVCKNWLYALGLLVIASVGLSGCALDRLEPLETTAEPSTQKNVGYILVSVTKNGGSNAWVEFRPLLGESRPLNVRGVGFFDRNDDFKDDASQSGRLMFIAVASGHYELTNWRLIAHSAIHHDRAIGPAALPGIPFFIKAQQITYLGNIHVDVEREASELPFELQLYRSAGVNISDRSMRDLAMFRERYVGFVDTPLRVSVKTHPDWALRMQLVHD
jgi:hypothetical protein